MVDNIYVTSSVTDDGIVPLIQTVNNLGKEILSQELTKIPKYYEHVCFVLASLIILGKTITSRIFQQNSFYSAP